MIPVSQEKENNMKTIILNGSPRKNWNTAQMLKEAQKGAESVGAETEYIDLFDLSYTGCRSCLACKRKGAERIRGQCGKSSSRPIWRKRLRWEQG